MLHLSVARMQPYKFINIKKFFSCLKYGSCCYIFSSKNKLLFRTDNFKCTTFGHLVDSLIIFVNVFNIKVKNRTKKYFRDKYKQESSFCLVPLVHWIRCNHDMCSFSNMCHDHSRSSVTGHWTKATPYK